MRQAVVRHPAAALPLLRLTVEAFGPRMPAQARVGENSP